MLKVVHVAPYFPPHIGGLQNHVDTLSREQARRGLDVTVVTSSFGARAGERTDELGRRIVRLPSFHVGTDAVPVGLLRRCLTEKDRYDLIHLHGHMFYSTTVGALCNKLSPRVPTIMTFHGDYQKMSWLGRRVKRVRDSTQGPFILGGVDRMIALTRYDAGFLESQGSDPSDIAVIPNGVPLDTFRPMPKQSLVPLRERVGVQEGDRVVLFVGRLVDQKGPTCLVNAIPHVLEDVPDARFLIVGEGPLQHKAMTLGRELGLEASLSFLGVLPIEDLIAAYNASWVVAVPSLWEGMPLVVLEAAACGRPVVATSVHGIPESVEPGRTGVLVPPRDPVALAEGISSVLTDPARARAMSEAALAKARAEFDLALQVDRTVELYKRVVEADAG